MDGEERGQGELKIFDLFKPDTALFSWKLVSEKQPNIKREFPPSKQTPKVRPRVPPSPETIRRPADLDDNVCTSATYIVKHVDDCQWSWPLPIVIAE